MLKNFTTDGAFSQIESCEYQCEGGPLRNDAAYRYLETYLAHPGAPKFLPGQPVWFAVLMSNDATGLKEFKSVQFHVVGMHADSGHQGAYWTYDLAMQMPEAYYTPKVCFSKVHETNLLANPEDVKTS